jgi:DNA-binding CsgD family transcriptional regulator
MLNGSHPTSTRENRSGDAASRLAALPPRCRDVLSGIVAGRSNKVIAYQLGISPRTVECHRAHMMQRLGARHVADAIRIAYEATQALVLELNTPQSVDGERQLRSSAQKQCSVREWNQHAVSRR